MMSQKLFCWKSQKSVVYKTSQVITQQAITCSKLTTETLETGFLTGVENVEGGSSKFDGGGLKSIHWGSLGRLKMLSKNICEKLFVVLFLGIIS